MKSINASASIKDGVITVTAANIDAAAPQKVLIETAGFCVGDVSVRVLHGDVHDMNTFEAPNAVHIENHADFTLTDEGVVVTLPACCVAEITLRG